MAYEKEIEENIEKICAKTAGLTSKRMFGGVCYLLRGHMVFGIHKDNLVVRLGSQEKARTFIDSGKALPFDITGRPMKGWIMIPKEKLPTSLDYKPWIEMGIAFAQALPPK